MANTAAEKAAERAADKAIEKARASTADYLNGFETAQTAYRDLMSFQVRTAKTMLETGMSFTKKATEHFVNQLEEGVRMQQDAIKYGLNLMDDWKKVAFESAEKSFRATDVSH